MFYLSESISNRKRRRLREEFLAFCFEREMHESDTMSTKESDSWLLEDWKTVKNKSAALDEKVHKITFNAHGIQVIEMVLMRIGVYEIIFSGTSNPIHTINECVALAKRYGSSNGYKLVNTVLDQVLKEKNAAG